MQFKDICSNIYIYLDFRLLLSDFFTKIRTLNSKYSMRYFSKKMGFGSPNYIQRILAGDRKLSETSLDAFIRVLRFDRNER
ncbi:MAG: TIGR02147 family protein, partial [Nitrospinota bacterium]